MTILYKKVNLLLSKNVKKKKINFLITGGQTAKGLYRYWQKDNFFFKNKKINFFLSDERLVSTKNKLSNYNLIKNNLKFDKSLIKYKFFSFFNDKKKFKRQLKNYRASLPKFFDVAVLSSGSDGHLASVFSSDKNSIISKQKIVFSYSDNHPKKRISLSLHFIKKSKIIIIMFKGKKKGEVAAKSMRNSSKRKFIISNFFKNFWIFDKNAYIAYKKNLTN